MKFLNEYHKQAMLHNMKQIEEWKKSPIDLKVALERQRNREKQAKEMEEKRALDLAKENELLRELQMQKNAKSECT